MKTVNKRIRAGLISTVVASSLLLTMACQPTPETVDKWANREGSEARFIGYMQNPEVSMDTRVRALEVLVDQWRYSASDFREAVIAIPVENGREEVVAGALPKIIERFETADNETQRVYTRDALFSLRRQTTSPANQNAIDNELVTWLKKDWSANPCREIGGIRERQIFEEVGREKTEGIMVALIDAGNWDHVYCLLQNTGGVSWRGQSQPVATALLGFWDKNLVPDSFQHQVTFFDHLVTFAGVPEVRTWAFEKIRGADVPTNIRGLLVALLSRTWSDEDLAGYQELLKNEDTYRWEAVRALTTLKGPEGLEMAFQGLPAESDYAYWNGARRDSGFNSAAKYVCSIKKIQEAPVAFIPVFQKWAAQSENLYVRVISTYCLGVYGNAATGQALTEIRSKLAKADDIAIPFWSTEESATVSTIMTQALEAIAARSAQTP